MAITAGIAGWRLSFELSPIILTNGIAQNIPGQMLPIIAITQSFSFVGGLLSGASIGLDDFFANFRPLPGTTLLEQQLGEYPFANQQVAANAVIFEPNVISFQMICPVRDEGGYAIKLATMTALQAALSQHNATGGTYTLVTPSYIYTNCVFLRLHDVTAGESKQAQYAWQWDFRQPLLTLQSAQAAQNSLMSQISNGTLISGQPAWSGTTASSNSTLGTTFLPPVSSSVQGTGVPGGFTTSGSAAP